MVLLRKKTKNKNKNKQTKKEKKRKRKEKKKEIRKRKKRNTKKSVTVGMSLGDCSQTENMFAVSTCAGKCVYILSKKRAMTTLTHADL